MQRDTGIGLLFSFLFSVIILELVLIALLYVMGSIAYMSVFKKAGVPAWKGWVPFLNVWTFTQLGGYSGALSLIATLLVSAFLYIPAVNVGKAFGKDSAGWIVLMILAFPVWMMILGFGSSEYRPERLPSGLEHARAAGARVSPAIAPAGAFAQAPFAQAPFAQAPFAQAPYAQAPYGQLQLPYVVAGQQQPHGQRYDPYGQQQQPYR